MDKANLRKAAILFECLDPESVGALVAQMSPAERQMLDKVHASLDDVTPAERQAVMEEFCRVAPFPAAPQPKNVESNHDEVTLELSPNAREQLDAAPSFDFLHETNTQQLAQFLRDEHPQTIAVVVAHLPSSQAAAVMAQFDGDTQSAVIRRLVRLREADPEVLREVERCLAQRIGGPIPESHVKIAGVEVVSAILQACDGRTEKRILKSLERHDRSLANLFDATEPCELLDLMQLSPADWRVLLSEVDHDILRLALADAPPVLATRVMQQLSHSERERLSFALDHLGTLRLNDVEAAQSALLELAEQLDHDGRIDLPRRRASGLAA